MSIFPLRISTARERCLGIYADLAWRRWHIDIAPHSLFILSAPGLARFTYSLPHSLAANRLCTSWRSIIECVSVCVWVEVGVAVCLTVLWQARWIDSSDLLFIFPCVSNSMGTSLLLARVQGPNTTPANINKVSILTQISHPPIFITGSRHTQSFFMLCSYEEATSEPQLSRLLSHHSPMHHHLIETIFQENCKLLMVMFCFFFLNAQGPKIKENKDPS